MTLICFKTYDIRGRLGDELNEEIAIRIGNAFAVAMKARRVVLGRDSRESSAPLAEAVAEGLVMAGVEVLELGLSGTEEMYFATTHLNADGGICVTASHNPIEYNGMKMVQKGSAPLDPDGSFQTVKAIAESGHLTRFAGGSRRPMPSARDAYVKHVLSFVDVAALRPMEIVVNAGNGAAGPTFDAITEALQRQGAPLTFHRMHHSPDGTFPNGIPNPMIEANRIPTAEKVQAVGADLAIAWDGDFDRCFLFDGSGAFVPGEYVVGLLAQAFLLKEPHSRIIHDPRVIWNTQESVANAGGTAILARTGHAFIKQAMRETGAIYGGEMSAHHYFRDFMSCDSGMIPWLLIVELLSRKDRPLAELVADRRQAYPSSGEINFTVSDTDTAIAAVEEHLAPIAVSRGDTDGLSLTFGDWRLNLRRSNTEPLVRLNVESRGRPDLVQAGVKTVSRILRST